MVIIMNKFFKLYLIFILSTFFVVNISDLYAKPPIVVSTINDGLILSKDIKQKFIIIFKNENCIYCNKLVKDISDDPEMLSDTIICYIDIKENKDIVKEYKVSTIPDSRLYDNGNFIKRIIGYSGKKDYLDKLK